jgi:hypothetical protein
MTCSLSVGGVVCNDLTELRPKGDDSRLVEFGVSNGNHRGGYIHVRHGQCHDFSNPRPGSIEQQQNRSQGVGLQFARRVETDGDRVQKAAYLIVAVNLGLETGCPDC